MLFLIFFVEEGVTEGKYAGKAPMKVVLLSCSWKPCSLQKRLGKGLRAFWSHLNFTDWGRPNETQMDTEKQK